MKRVLSILAFGLMFASCSDKDSINYEDYIKKYKNKETKQKAKDTDKKTTDDKTKK